jgi:hypothetical protein
MCSTPQKQPDAKVAFWVFSGKFCTERGSGLSEREVEDVKGRRKRARKEGIADGLKAMKMLLRSTAVRMVAWKESFSAAVVVVECLDQAFQR